MRVEIDDPRNSGLGRHRRFENERLADIATLGLKRLRGGDRAVPSAIPVQNTPEATVGVEAWHATPVDRSAPRHQCTAVAVSDECVVRNRRIRDAVDHVAAGLPAGEPPGVMGCIGGAAISRIARDSEAEEGIDEDGSHCWGSPTRHQPECHTDLPPSKLKQWDCGVLVDRRVGTELAGGMSRSLVTPPEMPGPRVPGPYPATVA